MTLADDRKPARRAAELAKRAAAAKPATRKLAALEPEADPKPVAAAVNGGSEQDDDVQWGCEAIAAVIKRKPRATFHLLEAGLLPAKKVGSRWCASRRRLLAHIAGE